MGVYLQLKLDNNNKSVSLFFNNKMSYLGIFVLLLISDFAFSDKLCLTENSCECVLPNKTVINLSPVGLPNQPRFHDVLFDMNCTESYSYNPCFAFDYPDKDIVTDPSDVPCTGASACVKSFGGADGNPPKVHAIGLQNLAAFGTDGNNAVYIEYSISKSIKKLRINLECTSSKSHILTMEDLKCSNSSDTIILTLKSKCACPNGCPKASPKDLSSSGLSTGSKLLIAFFTILLAYLIIGIVWNYCNGSQGMELIPNIEFWNGLPTLIMEGVVFTFSCCGRQSSYGEV